MAHVAGAPPSIEMKAEDPTQDAPTSSTSDPDRDAERAQLETDTEVEDVIPDGGYGWVIVGCLIGMNAVTWGVNTTYGVYSSYYIAHNHFSGGSTFRYAWVGGLSVATGLACGPPANWLARRYTFRVPLIFGVVCVTLGQCMAGVATTFAGFLACQGIIFGLGLGFTMIPCQPIVAHWFDKRLSLAQGIANCGSGLGGLVLANTTRLALETVGVKWSLIINGLISLAVMLPVVFLMKQRPRAVGSKPAPKLAPFKISFIWHPGFVWIWLFGFFVIISYFVALYSLASYATHGLGLSQTQGAALQSILSAGQMIGRPAWGLALDKLGRINMVIICYIIAGGACLAIWLPAKSFGVLVLFALVQGLTGGTLWSTATPLTAKVVGMKELGSALSIFWMMIVVPALVGQPIAILLLEYSTDTLGRTGPSAYYNSIGFCGATGLFSAMLLYGAKRHVQGDWAIWKIT